MEGQNLVNKPVKVEQIIEALRCTSAPGGPIGDCEKCPFWKTENLTPEQSEQLGTDEWASCDIDLYCRREKSEPCASFRRGPNGAWAVDLFPQRSCGRYSVLLRL